MHQRRVSGCGSVEFMLSGQVAVEEFRVECDAVKRCTKIEGDCDLTPKITVNRLLDGNVKRVGQEDQQGDE